MTKNKYFKIILPLCLVLCLLSAMLIIGSAVSANNAKSDTDSLNVILGVTTTQVEQNNTFKATVKISNADVDSFKVAGLQINLKYNTEKISVTDIKSDLDGSKSTYASKDDTANGAVRFAVVKNTFTENEGYTGTELANILTVTFKANTMISNPAALFDNESITYMMIGDTTAKEITKTNAIYGADKQALAEAIVNSEFTLKSTDNAGTVVLAEMGTTNGSFTIKDKEGNTIEAEATVGTGYKIEANGENAYIVVKGDLDGDGVVTVFDAMIAKKIAAEVDGYTGKPVYEFAGDVDDNGFNADDANSILKDAE
ncbi:MAG: hypothetical protein E7574_04910 [Ruminococcaceae bacterium]|nr:hypothetical protein [Oscillospiraceae bacterium]